ncbi:MAG TPA: glucosamine-6-phosphate deaminase, partial [Verrucomicrobiae bacterium]
MEIIIQPDSMTATRLAARIIARELTAKPASVLGLATGGTMENLYGELAGMALDWSRATTFNLDEYVGLSPDHPQSYRHFMQDKLFRHTNLNPARCHLPNGLAADVPGECSRYEAGIQAAGGLDLQLLGIGTTGHIGFNEPGSSLASRT